MGQAAAEKMTFTTGEAAKALGLPVWKLHYLLDRGVVAEPGRCGVLRAWSSVQIEAARRRLSERAQGQGVGHE